MITIETLVEQGANVKLEITPSDLKMFAESIVSGRSLSQHEASPGTAGRMRRHAQPVGEARLPRACQGRQQEHVCQVRCTPRADRGQVRKCNILLQEEKWLT